MTHRRWWRLARVMTLAAISAMVPVTATASGTAWPRGAKAAIVLTYDDALPSQLDHAVPALQGAGLKGTFFLANVRFEDVERWRAVAKAGHELANHTVFHPCAAATYPTDARYTAERYTVAGLLREVQQQNVLLRALDGRQRHGFATPCGQTLAGVEDYLEPLRRSGLVTYVRGVTSGPADLAADVATVDPVHVPARGFAEGTTLADLIAYAEAARSGGGWAVYLFHGIGGEHLRVSAEVHRQFLDWLAAHRQDYWVTTLQDALDWAKAQPGGPERSVIRMDARSGE
jgi:peptidoglycan/xylan/chitin deacetylase (PgdA/CDA1 family)